MDLKRTTKQIDLTGSTIEDWDFADADTTQFTHGIHQYPARMVPQLAERLIRRYTSKGQVVFDPFCGSGTVLLEAYRNGRKSCGSDINPLAALITRVKCSPLDDKTVEQLSTKILEDAEKERMFPLKYDLPEAPNLKYWFRQSVIQDLACIRASISRLDMDEDYRDFFRVCFSSTIYDVANLDKGDNPYFLRTLKGEKLEAFKPNALRTFRVKIDETRSRIRDLARLLGETKGELFKPKIVLGDSRELVKDIPRFDLMLTSPPYGEEKNTMSYMRFAKLACYWLGYTSKELKSLEATSLGARPNDAADWQPWSKELRRLLEELRGHGNEARSIEVRAFFADYCQLLEKANLRLKNNGYFCIVIGNRTAKGIPVRNDLITQELCEHIGMLHVATHYRNIPKKVLPRSDGKVNLINAESIVIMKKT